MTDASMQSPETGRHAVSLTAADPRTIKRANAEKRFRAYGIIAIATGLFFLIVLFASILSQAYPPFNALLSALISR